MQNMNTHSYMKNSIIAVGLGALVLASCARVAEEDDHAASLYDGMPIAFSAVAAADFPDTKVSYSGVDASGKERIDWAVGDRISIYCPSSGEARHASYSVSSITAENEKSTAGTVAPVDASSLLKWGLPSDGYTFYARFPDPTWSGGAPTESAFRSQSLDSDAFTCVIPAAQTPTRDGSSYTWLPDMKYCYLTGYGTAAKGNNVTLNFTPAVTAFEISIGNDYISANESFTVRTVELVSSSKRLSGTYTVGIGSTPSFTVPAPESEADRTCTFTPNTTVPQGSVLKFTLFTCPVDIAGTEEDHLSVKLTLLSGDVRTKELKDGSTWLSYTGGHKYRINLGTVPDPYSYNIDTDVTDLVMNYNNATTTTATVKVFSTKSKTGTITAAPWKAQYSADGGTSWVDMTTGVDGFTLSSYTGNGNVSGESITVTMPTATTTYTTSYSTYTFRREKGTQASPLDLSLYDLVRDPDCTNPLSRETANCYIVRSKGWYCFPLVFGNAIKDGAENSGSYTSSVSGNLGNVSEPFQSGLGDITSFSITGATAANIVWNTAGSCIESISLYDSNSDGTVDMLKFHVTDGIAPGSVVIAVTNGSYIIWSWHIWIVPDETDLTEKAVYDYSNSNALDFYMLTANLGQTPPASVEITGYQERVMKIRFVSTRDASAEPVRSSVVTVTRPARETARKLTGVILNPYYQWGRKDPMLPANTDKTDPMVSSDIVDANTLRYAAQNPGKFLKYNSSFNYNWYTHATWYNMWDMGLSGSNGTTHNATPVKSVYDPSPRGYCVARKNDFQTLNNNGTSTSGTWNTNAGNMGIRYFKTLYGGSETLAFPASGYRDYSDGSINGVGSGGYYWSSSSGSADNGSRSGFSSGGVNPLNYSYRAIGFAVRPVRVGE